MNSYYKHTQYGLFFFIFQLYQRHFQEGSDHFTLSRVYDFKWALLQWVWPQRLFKQWCQSPGTHLSSEIQVAWGAWGMKGRHWMGHLGLGWKRKAGSQCFTGAVPNISGERISGYLQGVGQKKDLLSPLLLLSSVISRAPLHDFPFLLNLYFSSFLPAQSHFKFLGSNQITKMTHNVI